MCKENNALETLSILAKSKLVGVKIPAEIDRLFKDNPSLYREALKYKKEQD